MALGYRRADATKVANHFIWFEDIMSKVAKMAFRGRLRERKLHCVGYLIELVYELMLGPSADVSSRTWALRSTWAYNSSTMPCLGYTPG